MSGPPATLSEFRAFTVLPSKKQTPEHGLARTFFKSWKWVSTRTGASLVSALRIISDVITYRSIRNPIEEGTTQTEILFFSAARLRELKEVITASRKAEKQAESKAWISTHDALVSLLWCCITQTWKDSNYFERDSNPLPLRRLLLQMFLRTTQLISVLAFYINGRRLIKDPPLQSYIGNVVITTNLGGPFTDVGSTLDIAARYAYALRRKILKFDEDYLMRLVSALGSVPDVTRLWLDWAHFQRAQFASTHEQGWITTALTGAARLLAGQSGFGGPGLKFPHSVSLCRHWMPRTGGVRMNAVWRLESI